MKNTAAEVSAAEPIAAAAKVLEVQNLMVRLRSRGEVFGLVDGVSFDVREGECLGILGESGSGKSMTCKAFMGLLDPSFEVGGSAFFQGRDLIAMPRAALRRLRGSEICMILQNPMSCFDPLYRIGFQMAESVAEHTALSRAEIRAKCLDTLEMMRIRNPEEVLEKYPHQLSGGMLQRVMIGLALMAGPRLIVADEPTTAIDAVTQYEIVEEFKRIKREHRTAMIFISHDLGVISELSDRVLVMHDARVRQRGSVEEVLGNPGDPSTRLLIESKMKVMNRFSCIMRRSTDEGVAIGENDCFDGGVGRKTA